MRRRGILPTRNSLFAFHSKRALLISDAEKVTQKRKYKHAHDEKPDQNNTNIFYNDPKQHYSLLNTNIPGDNKTDTAYYGAHQIASPPARRASESSQASPFQRSTHSASNVSTPRPSNVVSPTGSTPQLPSLGLQNTSSPLGHGSSSMVSPPPQSVVAAPANATITPPRPLTSRYSSGYSSNAAPVSPPSPTPASTSRPSSGTYVPLAQQYHGQQHSRGPSGASWSAAEARRTSDGSWRSSRGG